MLATARPSELAGQNARNLQYGNSSQANGAMATQVMTSRDVVPEGRDVASNLALDAASDSGSSAPPSSRSSQISPISSSHSRSVSNDTVPTRGRLESQDLSKFKSIGQESKKRKSGGVLGFLTLKEPSTSAWSEFAAAEKEKAKRKGASTPTSAVRATSSQKLPSHVPKVNSKWDGLPESARRESVRRKSSESKATKHGKQNSIASNMTTLTSGSDDSRGGRTKFGSLSNPLKSPRQPIATQPSGQSPLEYGRSSLSGTRKQPPALALETEAVELSRDNVPQTVISPPSPQELDTVASPETAAPSTPPELDGAEVANVFELDANNSANSSPAPMSPRTPPSTDESNSTQPALIGIHHPELDADSSKRSDSPSIDHAEPEHPVEEAPASRLNSARNTIVQQHAIIAQSIAARQSRGPINFSRPRGQEMPKGRIYLDFVSPSSTTATEDTAEQQEESVRLSSTLKNSSGRIDPFLTDTFAVHSRKTGRIPNRVASTMVRDEDLPAILEGIAEASDDEEQEQEQEQEEIYDDDDDEGLRAWAEDLAVAEHPSRTTTPNANIRSNSEVSVTPSEMSEEWRRSPKERLGLGEKLKIRPWEPSEDVAETASPGADGKLKRLSWRRSGGKK